jgi:hypothetical protein
MKIEYDTDTDVLTIEGERYSGAMFRHLPFLPIGSLFEVVKGKSGELCLRVLRIPETKE